MRCPGLPVWHCQNVAPPAMCQGLDDRGRRAVVRPWRTPPSGSPPSPAVVQLGLGRLVRGSARPLAQRLSRGTRGSRCVCLGPVLRVSQWWCHCGRGHLSSRRTKLRAITRALARLEAGAHGGQRCSILAFSDSGSVAPTIQASYSVRSKLTRTPRGVSWCTTAKSFCPVVRRVATSE